MEKIDELNKLLTELEEKLNSDASLFSELLSYGFVFNAGKVLDNISKLAISLSESNINMSKLLNLSTKILAEKTAEWSEN